MGSLTIQAADLFITPDSSLADAVRRAREMRRLGQSDTVTIHLAPGTYRLYEPLRLRPCGCRRPRGVYAEACPRAGLRRYGMDVHQP